jgi:pimeloyl-ACP methyl ester carboxylesterase
MIGWLGLTAAATAAAAPFIMETMRPRMGDAARRNAPGQIARLPRGDTHYRWLGAAEGPVAVCVHGLTTPSFVWEPVAERLGRMGFRVLVYDLYGRGFSARPGGAQDSDFFITQLEDLLDHEGVDGDVTLLGYSMGGAIATAFAARHHLRLRQVVLIAPAGLGHDLGPIADLAVNYNWLGRWLMLGFYGRSLRRATEAERGLPSAIEGMVDRQIAETRWKGFAPAVLSSLRGIIDEDLEPAHRTIVESGLPVLAIWAGKDEVIPISGLGKLAEWNRDARQEVIEDAGHTVAYTHVDEVAAALKEGITA